jgi:hypothetical protein
MATTPKSKNIFLKIGKKLNNVEKKNKSIIG